MKRIAIAAVAFACLLGACSNEGGERSDETTSTSAPETPDETTSTSTSAPEMSDETTSTSAPETPGGTTATLAGEKLLIEEGLLEGGVVSLGPVGPTDEAVNHAICDYVFGSPEVVATTAEVDGDVALTEESGFAQLGGNGSGVRCVYTVEGEDAFGLRVWSKEQEIDDDANIVVADTAVNGGRFALMVRAPDWDGNLGLDEDAATEWIEDAATRWGGSSV